MEELIKKRYTEIVQAIRRSIELEKQYGCSAYLVTNERSVPRDGRGPGSKSEDSWEGLEKELASCSRCELCGTRTTVVVGSGSRNARLVFVGEAPGEEEDRQGKPFVGRAGELLTKIIEAMGLTRSQVYIANVLKCRPPNNRAPLPTEICACQDNLKMQIALIKPKVIVTLGKFASQTLLKTETPISKLRGVFSVYEGIDVMPTFHPAYLLRNPQDKRLVWEDMKKVMKKLAERR